MDIPRITYSNVSMVGDLRAFRGPAATRLDASFDCSLTCVRYPARLEARSAR
jgi:hypothetical protein